MHEHNEGHEHRLKYCEHCDVVYCEICKREWGKTVYVPYYYYQWADAPRTYPYVITYTSGTTNAVVTHIHS